MKVHRQGISRFALRPMRVAYYPSRRVPGYQDFRVRHPSDRRRWSLSTMWSSVYALVIARREGQKIIPRSSKYGHYVGLSPSPVRQRPDRSPPTAVVHWRSGERPESTQSRRPRGYRRRGQRDRPVRRTGRRHEIWVNARLATLHNVRLAWALALLAGRSAASS